MRHFSVIAGHLLDPVFGHTRIVLGTKTIVFSIALLLSVLLFILPMFHSKTQDYIDAGEQAILKRITTPTMMNPRFQGIDSHKQPYHIVADTAIKTADDRLVLTNVNADMTLTSSELITAKATQAIYAIGNKEVSLFGTVIITSSSGYEATTSSAHIDLATSSASGQNTIYFKGPLGELTAGSFAIPDVNHMVFKNRVKLLLYPKNRRTSSPKKPITSE